MTGGTVALLCGISKAGHDEPHLWTPPRLAKHLNARQGVVSADPQG
jgi:hypothetical protein